MNKFNSIVFKLQEEIKSDFFFLNGSILSCIAVLISTFCTVSSVHADLFDKAQSSISDIYTSVFTIAFPIAVLLFIVALMVSLFTNNQQATQKWLSWAKRILVTFILILLAVQIFNYVGGIFADSSSPDSLEFNPGK